MKSRDFFGGLLVGVSIGVATGIILAPEKGNDTLKKLTDVLKDKFNQYKGQAQDVLSDAKSKGKEMLQDGQDMAEEHMQDGEQKINELKNKFNNAHS